MGVAIALLAVAALLLAAALAPRYPMYTTGSTTGAPRLYPHRWSVAEHAHVQLRYAQALRLSPRQLLRAMAIGIPPGTGQTPEEEDVAKNALSTRTTTLFRWRESLHAPATRLARAINQNRPRLLVAFTTGLAQLTGLRERGLVAWTPEVVVLHGGHLGDEEWAATRKAWEPARVEQFYGASECPLIAVRAAGGSYRAAPGSQVRPTAGGVWVRGFPLRTWLFLADDVRPARGGGLAIGNARPRYYDAMVACGERAVRRGQLEAFQIQRLGGAEYRVVHVSGLTPAEVRAVFAEELPAEAAVAAGERHFRAAFGREIKRAGFADLRGAQKAGPAAHQGAAARASSPSR